MKLICREKVSDMRLVYRNGSEWWHADLRTGHVHHACSRWCVTRESRQPDALYSWFDIFVLFRIRKAQITSCWSLLLFWFGWFVVNTHTLVS